MSISTREALRIADSGLTAQVQFSSPVQEATWLRSLQTQAHLEKYVIEMLKSPQGPIVKLSKLKV